MDPNLAEWHFMPMPGHQVRVTLSRKGQTFEAGSFVTEVVLATDSATSIANTLHVLEAQYFDLPEADLDDHAIILEDA